jgi:soluble lytic murein transglycosylase-like protein
MTMDYPVFFDRIFLNRTFSPRPAADDLNSRKATMVVAAGFGLLLAAAPAVAQVLEIGDDGNVARVGGGWPAEAVPASAPPAPSPFAGTIAAAAARYDLSPSLVDAVAHTESRYRADAVSPAGALGVMQLMPATARGLGVDPKDPVQNIFGGAAYLRAQIDRFDGALDLALAAYNAGPAKVAQAGGVPAIPETRAYVARNLERLAASSTQEGNVP